MLETLPNELNEPKRCESFIMIRKIAIELWTKDIMNKNAGWGVSIFCQDWLLENCGTISRNGGMNNRLAITSHEWCYIPCVLCSAWPWQADHNFKQHAEKALHFVCVILNTEWYKLQSLSYFWFAWEQRYWTLYPNLHLLHLNGQYPQTFKTKTALMSRLA